MFRTLLLFKFSSSKIFFTFFPSVQSKSHAEYRQQIPYAESCKFGISKLSMLWKWAITENIFSLLLGWLAHLVSRFTCNTKVRADASSSKPISKLPSHNQSNGNSIRSSISSSSSLVNASGGIKKYVIFLK